MSTPSGPGWYDNPDNPEQLRYFDGIVWTPHTTPRRIRSLTSETATAPTTHPSQDVGEVPPRPAGAVSRQQPSPYAAPPAASATVHTGPVPPDGRPLASYLSRVGAYLIDSVLTQILALLVGFYPLYQAFRPVLEPLRAAVQSDDVEAMLAAYSKLSPGWFGLFLGISLAVRLVYDVAFLMRLGAQPGKLLLGIRVRAVDQEGRLTFDQASRRAAFMVGLTALGVLPIIGFAATMLTIVDLVWPISDAKRQALHDKVAGTLVVKGRVPQG